MGKERPTWGSERKILCFSPFGLAMESFFRRTFGPITPENGLSYSEVLSAFPLPNPDLALVNSSVIPGEYGIHHPGERIVHTINYGDLGIGIYGEGIVEAIDRGQKVTLTVEQPYGLRNFGLPNWTAYVESVARTYQPTQFIVGNETNVEPHYLPPIEYFRYFLAAKGVINRLSPNTEVLPAAEAYCGEAEYFDEFLSICHTYGVEISTLPFHFYGYPEELFQRVELLRNICQRHHYPETKLIATEMSRPENETLSEEELADFIYQTHIASAQLIGRGLEFGAWFCGYDFGKGNGHTLFENKEDQILPRRAFNAYLFASRLLYQNVRQETDDILTKVHSETADGIPILSVWANSAKTIRVRVPKNTLAFDTQGNNVGRLPELARTKKLPNTVIFIPKEALGVSTGSKPYPI